ncbi:MAG: hypothetical protein Q3966_06035 [Neisseria sp.]|nr:hypothetical protein [Neisseria sp.]
MKNIKFYLFSRLALIGLCLLPAIGWEVESAGAAELSCSHLSTMRYGQMSGRQKRYAAQCDAVAADMAWEKQYGMLDEAETLRAALAAGGE